MPDGREVSSFRGGSQNPDGSIKRKNAAPEEAKAKKQAVRTQRAASKAANVANVLAEAQGGAGRPETVAGKSDV